MKVIVHSSSLYFFLPHFPYRFQICNFWAALILFVWIWHKKSTAWARNLTTKHYLLKCDCLFIISGYGLLLRYCHFFSLCTSSSNVCPWILGLSFKTSSWNCTSPRKQQIHEERNIVFEDFDIMHFDILSYKVFIKKSSK